MLGTLYLLLLVLLAFCVIRAFQRVIECGRSDEGDQHDQND